MRYLHTMLRVRDQPLIERHMNALVGAGVRRIVINLAWLGTQIRDYLGDGTRYGAVIHYSEEAPRALQPADRGGDLARPQPGRGEGLDRRFGCRCEHRCSFRRWCGADRQRDDGAGVVHRGRLEVGIGEG